MKGIPYKDTFAAKGSDLYKALTESKPEDRDKNAKKVYDETTVRMKQLYKKETK